MYVLYHAPTIHVHVHSLGIYGIIYTQLHPYNVCMYVVIYIYIAEDPAEGWRCPACQNGSPIVPTLYKCYCGKLTNPRPHSKGDLTAPHSCGDLCRRNLAKTSQSSCQHKCQLLCHPGKSLFTVYAEGDGCSLIKVPFVILF